jgi:hypothetical protein
MNVHAGPEGRRRLVRQARVPWDHGPILVVPATHEQFAIHAIRCPGKRASLVKTAVLLSPGQRPEQLPDWRPARGAFPARRAGLFLRLLRQAAI